MTTATITIIIMAKTTKAPTMKKILCCMILNKEKIGGRDEEKKNSTI